MCAYIHNSISLSVNASKVCLKPAFYLEAKNLMWLISSLLRHFRFKLKDGLSRSAPFYSKLTQVGRMMALNCEGTLGLQIIWLIASSTVMLSGAGMWSWFSADVHEVSMFLPSL